MNATDQTQAPAPATAKPTAKPAVKKTVAAKTKVAAKVVAPKPVSKVAAKPVVPVAKAAKETPAAKSAKVKKPKLVRDSLTIPKAEYEVLADLKLRAAKLGNPVKKTELIRAGIKAIAAMKDQEFLAAVQAVPSLKTGRPNKE